MTPTASSSGNRVTRGIVTALLSRGVTVLMPLITVPMALGHLGATSYGAWTAALSLTSFAVFADLGLGVGLMTRLAGMDLASQGSEARKLVSSAYAAVGAVVGLLITAMWVSSIWVSWGRIVGGASADNDLIVLVTLTIFLINVVTALIVRVQFGVHQVSRSNLWQAVGSVTGVLGVALASLLDTSAPVFVILASGLPSTVALLNAFWFFAGRQGRLIRPAFRLVTWTDCRSLVGVGIRFSAITVLLSIGMSTDAVIIAHTVDLDVVPDYAITARLFGMLSAVVSALSIPLWTANARALHTNDLAWVRHMTKRMVVVSTMSVSALSVVAIALAPIFIDVWLGGAIAPSVALLSGLGLVSVVQATAAPLFMVQNAAEVLGPQTWGYLLFLGVVPVKWWISESLGMDFVPWVTAVGYCLIVLPAALVGYRQVVAREKRLGVECVSSI